MDSEQQVLTQPAVRPRTTVDPVAEVPTALFDDPVAENRWRERFSAVRIASSNSAVLPAQTGIPFTPQIDR